MPLLYTLVLGLLISIPKFKILTIEQMEKSADYIGIAVMILMVKVGLGIGPNLGILTSAGWALLLQELGHFFGTIIFGLPVALLVGMRREAVGACYSVDREPNVRSSSTNSALALQRAVALWACTSVAFLSVLCGLPYWQAC